MGDVINMKIKTIIPSLFVAAITVALLIGSNGFAYVNAQGSKTPMVPTTITMVVESNQLNQYMKREQWYYHQL